MNLTNIKNMELDLGKRDKILSELEAQMYAKRFLLIQKRRAMENAIKQNQFLKDVKKDYDTYYEHIVKQKSDQIHAIEYLDKYIADIIDAGNMSDEQMRTTAEHQTHILRELKNIKSELDQIIHA